MLVPNILNKAFSVAYGDQPTASSNANRVFRPAGFDGEDLALGTAMLTIAIGNQAHRALAPDGVGSSVGDVNLDLLVTALLAEELT